MAEPMDEVELTHVLMDLPLLENLDSTQISRVLNVCKQQEVPAGSVLCEALTIDERLFVLLAGRLRLESTEGVKLNDLTPISVVGEMGILIGHSRSSRLVVEEAAMVLELGGADLGELIESDPDMGHQILINLIKVLYTRLHSINEDLEGRQKQVDLLRQRLTELAPDDPLLKG